jgi:aminoglycoside/choline kinase family phosphotransferase
MTDRAAEIQTFLEISGVADWQRQGLALDASTRRYLRLTKGDASLIVMDGPSDTDKSHAAFLRIATILREAGLAAPEILADDAGRGLILMEDLGETDLARHLKDCPDTEAGIAEEVVDILVRLAQMTPPEGLQRLTPSVGVQMLEPLYEHYSRAPQPDLDEGIAEALETHAGPATTLSLRDFHAENIIWRPEREGPDRVGLLDFQDAFIAPLAYDLASYLRDVRRDVPGTIRDAMLKDMADKTGKSLADLTRAATVLAVQRNLRILGIFARLVRQDGKRKYLAFLPRVWRHLDDDLSHPHLARLRAAVADLPRAEAFLEEVA